MKKYVITNDLYYISNYTNERVSEVQKEIIIPEEYKDIFPRKFMFFKIINNELSYDNQSNLNNLEKKPKYKKLSELKNLLQETDYKIIKCYESFMRQLPLPYNLEELSAQRDAWRAEINQLEEELKAL
jgi:hypothetical protein